MCLNKQLVGLKITGCFGGTDSQLSNPEWFIEEKRNITGLELGKLCYGFY